MCHTKPSEMHLLPANNIYKANQTRQVFEDEDSNSPQLQHTELGTDQNVDGLYDFYDEFQLNQ